MTNVWLIVSCILSYKLLCRSSFDASVVEMDDWIEMFSFGLVGMLSVSGKTDKESHCCTNLGKAKVKVMHRSICLSDTRKSNVSSPKANISVVRAWAVWIEEISSSYPESCWDPLLEDWELYDLARSHIGSLISWPLST